MEKSDEVIVFLRGYINFEPQYQQNPGTNISCLRDKLKQRRINLEGGGEVLHINEQRKEVDIKYGPTPHVLPFLFHYV